MAFRTPFGRAWVRGTQKKTKKSESLGAFVGVLRYINPKRGENDK